MGMLAEKKSRRKLNHDPNNTKWSRDTTTFGQKILRSQGWQPGEYLGAQDSAHSEFHTAANASYIRVSLKDDMKGLGFDKRKEDEITGLNEFSDLLSRLNGKSTKSVEQERAKRLEVKMNAWVQHRYGAMRFVRGGLLVGDELKKDDEQDTEASETADSDEGSSDGNEAPTKTEAREAEGAKLSKKRKAMDDDDDDVSVSSSSSSSSDEEEDRKKRRKKEKKEKSKAKKSKKSSAEASEDEDSAERKSKSKRKSKSSPSADTDDSSDDKDEAKRAKRARKAEKRARKELKRAKKEEKRRKKKNKDRDAESETTESAPTTSTATPVVSGASTPRVNNPHRVRSRFLAAKREALMDQKALDKIWMVKT